MSKLNAKTRAHAIALAVRERENRVLSERRAA